MRSPLSRREVHAAWVIAALAVLLRFYFSWICYLNPDEALHLRAAVSGQWFSHFHPPLIMAWLWAASLISEHPAWLRLPMTLAGGLTPLLLALWLRRFVSPAVAWGLATLVAVSPNLVMLSFQIRGYSLSILFSIAAMWTIEEAFQTRSRRMLALHWLCLAASVLAEFAAVWTLLAAGLYGLFRLGREPDARSRLLASWIAAQMAALGICTWLWVFVLSPNPSGNPVTRLSQHYLAGGFPQSGESLVRFSSSGLLKQFAYAASSAEGGAIALALFAIGLAVFWRRGCGRWAYSVSPHLAALGAIAGLAPYGRSRHSVTVGVLSLAAVAMGIEWLGGRRHALRWLTFAALAFCAAVFPGPDQQNIELWRWHRIEMEQALNTAIDSVPPDALILTDSDTYLLMAASLMTREEQQALEHGSSGRPERAMVRGRRVQRLAGDWSQIGRRDPEKFEEALRAETQPVWLIDTGFAIGALDEPHQWPGSAAITMVKRFGMVLHLAKASRAATQ
ncbi:MAG: hypothetical protein U0Q18_00415 [Bryobacteraceae bacterium]